MTKETDRPVGRIAGLWRYPVKSMQGEPITEASVSSSGVEGDRIWAVVDEETGKVASAKHPRKWGALLECQATTVANDDRNGVAGVTVTLPDGVQASAGPAADEALSDLLGRRVRLTPAAAGPVDYEGTWPDIEGLAPPAFIEATRVGVDQGETVLGLRLADAAPGTFLDVAPLHLVTGASLAALKSLAPDVEVDIRRFRPNVLVEPVQADDGPGVPSTGGRPAVPAFPEDEWAASRLTLGGVTAAGLMPTMRCIMTTMAQPGLPPRPELLRALARDHRIVIGGGKWACLGLYATVASPGRMAVGDEVSLLAEGPAVR